MRIAIDTDWPTGVAVTVSLAYLAIFALVFGNDAFLGVLLYLVLPWAFFIYPEELGSWAYGTPGTNSIGVNRPTPGRFVYWMGWLFLAAPGVYVIILHI